MTSKERFDIERLGNEAAESYRGSEPKLSWIERRAQRRRLNRMASRTAVVALPVAALVIAIALVRPTAEPEVDAVTDPVELVETTVDSAPPTTLSATTTPTSATTSAPTTEAPALGPPCGTIQDFFGIQGYMVFPFSIGEEKDYSDSETESAVIVNETFDSVTVSIQWPATDSNPPVDDARQIIDRGSGENQTLYIASNGDPVYGNPIIDINIATIAQDAAKFPVECRSFAISGEYGGETYGPLVVELVNADGQAFVEPEPSVTVDNDPSAVALCDDPSVPNEVTTLPAEVARTSNEAFEAAQQSDLVDQEGLFQEIKLTADPSRILYGQFEVIQADLEFSGFIVVEQTDDGWAATEIIGPGC